MLIEAHPGGPPAAVAASADARCGQAASASRGSSPQIDSLTAINLDDLFDAAGLMCLRHTPLRHLLWSPARRFAVLAHEFDDLVGEQGLALGSSWLAHRVAGGTLVAGGEHVPAAGPAVILANHPGMTDTIALLASLGSRPDLRVIALDRPFLRALPNVARHLILVPDDDGGRMGVLRAGVKHLKQGGALLTFPAGAIEPDPAAFGRRKALESLPGWSDSFVLFARRVPQTRFVPAIVSNVISPQALGHALTLLRRTAHDKERLAAALQVAMPRYQKLVARVTFGPAKVAGAGAIDALRSAIVGEVRRLIEAAVESAEPGTTRDDPARGARRHEGGHAPLPRAAGP